MFTKKHYIMLASIIKRSRDEAIMDGGIDAIEAVDGFIRRLAAAFGRDNPNFDEEKFIKACGAKP